MRTKRIFTITLSKGSIAPAAKEQIKKEFEAEGAVTVFIEYNQNQIPPSIQEFKS